MGWRTAVLVTAVMATGLGGTAARAEYFVTGRDLYERCTAAGTPNQVFCYGFIVGIADVMEDNPLDGRSACIPRDATMEQVTAVVLRFLADNPDIRQFSGESLTVQSLSEAFPCRTPKKVK